MAIPKVFKLFNLFGIRVYIDWWLIAALILVGIWGLSNPLIGFLIVGVLIITLVHELGHAYFAYRYNRHVHYIVLGLLGGKCIYDEAETEYENAVIAWGGVVAQLVIAIPALVAHYTLGTSIRADLEMILLTFGLVNLLLIVGNLIPTKGLDGSICWKAIPLYLKYRKRPSKTKKRHLKSIK